MKMVKLNANPQLGAVCIGIYAESRDKDGKKRRGKPDTTRIL